mgnify:CR=1 FL=1
MNRWFIIPSAASCTYSHSSERARSGGLSLKLHCDAVSNQRVDAIWRVAYPSLSKLGLEFSFIRDEGTYSAYFLLEVWSSTTKYWTRVYCPYNGNNLGIEDEAGIYHDVGIGIVRPLNEYIFNTVKLIVDPPNKKCVSLRFNNLVYDISQYGLQSVADTEGPQIRFFYRLSSTSIAARDTWLDDIIITNNE